MQYEDWTDPATAEGWDADQTTRNPTRVEQLDIMLSVLGDEYKPGSAILDVGMGSGIVEEMIFERIPGAYVLGVDSSEAMVALARKRLERYEDRYDVVMHDLMDIGSIKLPDKKYGAAISVQVIHNVADEYKRPIFSWVYSVLDRGGLFLLLDRMAVDTPDLFGAYASLWSRMEREYDAHMREGASYDEHHRIVSTRGDMPANLEQHLKWLREAGFVEVACLHLHANRALIAARKA